MRTIKFISLLLFPIFAISQALITNIPNRVQTTLNGNWDYIVDPYENGYYSFHRDVFDQQKSFQKAAFYNNYHAKDKQELVEYDFDTSPKMKIPGDWNSQVERLFWYDGVHDKMHKYIKFVYCSHY